MGHPQEAEGPPGPARLHVEAAERTRSQFLILEHRQLQSLFVDQILSFEYVKLECLFDLTNPVHLMF